MYVPPGLKGLMSLITGSRRFGGMAGRAEWVFGAGLLHSYSIWNDGCGV